MNRTLAILLWMCGALEWALAGGPGILQHQGRVMVSGTNFSGTAEFKFLLLTTNQGVVRSLWSHDATSVQGSQPTGTAVTLGVQHGVFSVGLGDVLVPGMAAGLPSAVFTNSDVHLRTWLRVGAAGWQQLLPDHRITTTPYALTAERFSGRLEGQVSGPQDAIVVDSIAGMSAATVAAGSVLLVAATNRAAASSLVRRDAQGAFSAGTILATPVGDGSGLGNVPASQLVGTVAGAVHFVLPLVGEVSGPQHSNVAGTVGGMAAAEAAAGVVAANAATVTSSAGQLVARDPCDSSLAAGTIIAPRFAGNGSRLMRLPPSSVRVSPRAGAMVASLQSLDSTLIASGYQEFMNTSSPAWASPGTSNAPSARKGHTAIYDGQHVIVWGGQVSSSTYSGTGALYDPAADSWEVLNPVGSPSARGYHTAVWTGQEMIVWGGSTASGYLNTGARFSPVTQSWRTLPTSGAPTGRRHHLAVWTGSRMLVWGGLNGSGLLNDGALYDPVTDRWTALAIADPPEERMKAVGVWAEDRFLVWGGIGAAGELGTGGELRFSAGEPVSWTATTLEGAPSARSGCTAVWTGGQMMIWGGQGALGPMNDGAGYRPADGSWIPVSSIHAPPNRFDHAAVWTGSEMLVLGGANLAGDLSDSAAYDPATGEWRSLSSAGSPLARSQLAAVWADTEVMVFGGSASGRFAASLQRLLPTPAWHFYRKL